jgi:membrane protein required for colicin V production
VNLPIHTYDVVMLIVLVVTTLFGAWKGMAWQLASIASVLVSAAVAFHFGAAAAPLFGHSEPWNRFIAMLVLYLVTSAGIWLLFRLVSRLIDRVQLKEFDRQVGAVFGFLKGILLCLLITFFAVTLSETARQAILNTYSGRSIAGLLERAGPFIPDDVRAVLGKYIDELDRKLDPSTVAEPSLADHLEDVGELERSGRGLREKLDAAGERLERIGSEIEGQFKEYESSRKRGAETNALPSNPSTSDGIGRAPDDGRVR